ncbi:MAG TPA: tetratricopeptide repeat protein [Candidatus Obscuribacterales bacterium]
MKRLCLTLSLLFCLTQAAGAATRSFELSRPVTVMNNQLPEAAKMLATLQLKHQLRKNISDYLAQLPALASLDRKTQLEPLAIMLFPLELLELNQGHDLKVKALIDTDALPENLPEYLKENHEQLATIYRHMLHSQALEGDFSSFMLRLAQASPQEAMQLQVNEGKQLQDRVKATELFLLGCEAIGLKRWTKAESQFSQAIALTPDYSLAYFMRGITYLLTETYDKAIEDFSQDLKLEPQHQSGYFLRGIAYTIQAALPDKAISDFSRTIELNPQHGEAYYLRGVNYNRTKQCDKAKADFTKACNLGYSKACQRDCNQEAPAHVKFQD